MAENYISRIQVLGLEIPIWAEYDIQGKSIVDNYATKEGLSTEIANKISELVGAAPENLNTLEEIAKYLDDNPDLADFLGLSDRIGKLDINLSNRISLLSDEDLNIKNSLENYALKSEIPTDYLTSIPEEYITDSKLEAKGYVLRSDIPTNHIDWVMSHVISSGYERDKRTTVLENEHLIRSKTNQLFDENGAELPAGRVTPVDTKGNIKSEVNVIQLNAWNVIDIGDPSTLTNINIPKGYRPTIQEQGLSGPDAYKMAYLSDVELLKADIENKGYLTEVPAEYVTDSELAAKNYLTSIPDEYVTETELNAVEAKIPENPVTWHIGSKKSIRINNSDIIEGKINLVHAPAGTPEDTYLTMLLLNDWNLVDVGSPETTVNLTSNYKYTPIILFMQNPDTTKNKLYPIAYVTTPNDNPAEYTEAAHVYTRAEVDNKIQTSIEEAVFGNVDLTNYYTKEETNSTFLTQEDDSIVKYTPFTGKNTKGILINNNDLILGKINPSEVPSAFTLMYPDMDINGYLTLILLNPWNLVDVGSPYTTVNLTSTGLLTPTIQYMDGEQKGTYQIAYVEPEDPTNPTLYTRKALVYTLEQVDTLIENITIPEDIATLGYVDGKIAALVDGAPDALNTLKELADKLEEDKNFSGTVLSNISNINSNVSNLTSRVDTLEGIKHEEYALKSELDNKADSTDVTDIDARVKALEEKPEAVVYTGENVLLANYLLIHDSYEEVLKNDSTNTAISKLEAGILELQYIIASSLTLVSMESDAEGVIEPQTTVTLTVTNARHLVNQEMEAEVSIIDDKGNIIESGLNSNSEVQVTPTETTTYTLRAVFANGLVNTFSVTVEVNESEEPPIIDNTPKIYYGVANPDGKENFDGIEDLPEETSLTKDIIDSFDVISVTEPGLVALNNLFIPNLNRFFILSPKDSNVTYNIYLDSAELTPDYHDEVTYNGVVYNVGYFPELWSDDSEGVTYNWRIEYGI